MISFISFLLLANLPSFSSVDIDSLRFVHAIWRHGDRTPSGTFPTDPNKIWDIGFGELTTTGMRQQFELGQYIQQRYQGFLNPNYNSFEVEFC